MEQAVPFSVTSEKSHRLDYIEIPVSVSVGDRGSSRLELLDDDASIPGTSLETFLFPDVTAQFGHAAEVVRGVSLNEVVLHAGQHYWLAGSSSHSSMVWHLNDQGIITDRATRGDDQPWHVQPPDEDPAMAYRVVGWPVSDVPGDFSGNGTLDAIDLDLLSIDIQAGRNRFPFDLNGDDLVDHRDRVIWIHELKETWLGDSNLDSAFNSQDFVQVFQTGKYETGQNAGWAEGDWDANGRFDSADFITAFTDGGYEQGPRQDVAAVPEPGGWLLFALGLSRLLFGGRLRQSG